MQKVIEKASVLIEALPYIQRFRNEIVVIKFGGSAMENADRHDDILADITFMECVGMLPVIVHGGGKAISRALQEKGIRSKFVKGLRVTDESTIGVVREVLGGSVNQEIVKTIASKGGKAKGIQGETVFKVTKETGVDEETGETLDWGFVGTPVSVDIGPVNECLKRRSIPVITPLGTGPDGKLYNINADDAAGAVAKALKARKLVFLSDVPGLLERENDPASVVSTLRESDVEQLVKRGVITGGMLPKIRGAIEALKAGVRQIHIVDGRLPHSLLLEVFTDKGVGTEIVE